MVPWHRAAMNARSQTSTPTHSGVQTWKAGSQPQRIEAARRRSPFGPNRAAAGTGQLTRIAFDPVRPHTHLQHVATVNWSTRGRQ